MDLGGREQAVSSTLPWLALGAVLGLALLAFVLLVVALAVRRRTDRPARLPEEWDDLPAFLEHPPGSPGAPATAAPGWAALGAAPAAPPVTRRRPTTRTLAVLAAAAAALLLVGTAAALAGDRSRDRRDHGHRHEATDQDGTDRDGTDRDGTEARLTFGGVVLERRAVGVTATYPELTLAADGVARLRLPTFNCLADRAPADPAAAGCLRSQTFTADLAEPELEVVRDGDGIRVSGTFETWLASNGTPPEPTGAAYAVDVRIRPAEDGEGWVPAEGTLEMGGDSAPTTGDSEVRLDG